MKSTNLILIIILTIFSINLDILIATKSAPKKKVVSKKPAKKSTKGSKGGKVGRGKSSNKSSKSLESTQEEINSDSEAVSNNQNINNESDWIDEEEIKSIKSSKKNKKTSAKKSVKTAPKKSSGNKSKSMPKNKSLKNKENSNSKIKTEKDLLNNKISKDNEYDINNNKNDNLINKTDTEEIKVDCKILYDKINDLFYTLYNTKRYYYNSLSDIEYDNYSGIKDTEFKNRFKENNDYRGVFSDKYDFIQIDNFRFFPKEVFNVSDNFLKEISEFSKKFNNNYQNFTEDDYIKILSEKSHKDIFNEYNKLISFYNTKPKLIGSDYSDKEKVYEGKIKEYNNVNKNIETQFLNIKNFILKILNEKLLVIILNDDIKITKDTKTSDLLNYLKKYSDDIISYKQKLKANYNAGNEIYSTMSKEISSIMDLYSECLFKKNNNLSIRINKEKIKEKIEILYKFFFEKSVYENYKLDRRYIYMEKLFFKSNFYKELIDNIKESINSTDSSINELLNQLKKANNYSDFKKL